MTTKSISSFSLLPLLLIAAAFYIDSSQALFHQSGQANRQSAAAAAGGQSASLYASHFGQPAAAAGAAGAQQLANLTSASHYTQPFYYEYDRDPRQFGYYGYSSSPFGGYGNNGWLSNGFGSVEAIVVCLLVIVGVGVLGFPLLLLLFSVFSTGLGTPATGFNFIPPSSTTTVNGRRKRSADLSPSLMKRLLEVNSVNDLLALQELHGLSELVMANVRPEIREKAVQYFKQFSQAPDKMKAVLQKIIQ